MEAHQNSHHWPWSVTKRGIKTTITATTARGCRNICKAPTTLIQCIYTHWKSTTSYSDTLLFPKKISYTDFGIRDAVAGTTSVTTLKELSYPFHDDTDADPFKRTCNNWRIWTSSPHFLLFSLEFLHFLIFQTQYTQQHLTPSNTTIWNKMPISSV